MYVYTHTHTHTHIHTHQLYINTYTSIIERSFEAPIKDIIPFTDFMAELNYNPGSSGL